MSTVKVKVVEIVVAVVAVVAVVVIVAVVVVVVVVLVVVVEVVVERQPSPLRALVSSTARSSWIGAASHWMSAAFSSSTRLVRNREGPPGKETSSSTGVS